MESPQADDKSWAQHKAREELMSILKDMAGENAPVELVIAFRCPDGQIGFYRTPGYLPGQIGLIELVKQALIKQGTVQQVQPVKGAH